MDNTKKRKRITFLCLGLNVITILFVLLIDKRIPPEVPLLYGMPTGESQLVVKRMLLLPSSVALILSLINFGLITRIKDDFLKNALIGSSIATTILAIIAVTKIILLIGNI